MTGGCQSEVELQRTSRLLEHKQLDTKALKSALKNRDSQLAATGERIRELEEALSRLGPGEEVIYPEGAALLQADEYAVCVAGHSFRAHSFCVFTPPFETQDSGGQFGAHRGAECRAGRPEGAPVSHTSGESNTTL